MSGFFERLSACFTRERLKSLQYLVAVILIIAGVTLILVLIVKATLNILGRGNYGCYSEFYKLGCRLWEKRKKNIGRRLSNPFSADSIYREIEVSLLSSPSHGEKELEAIRKTKLMYNACLKTPEGEQNGKNLLKSYIDSFGGWPLLHGRNWNHDMKYALQILGKTWRKSGANGLFTFLVVPNIHHDHTPALLIGINEHDPFPHFIPMGRRKLDQDTHKYVQLMIRVAEKLAGRNFDRSIATRDAERVLSVIIQVIKLVKERGRKKSIAFSTIHELSSELQLDLVPMFHSLLVDIKTMTAADPLFVHDKEGMHKLVDYMKELGARTVVNVAVWSVIFPLLWHTNEDLRKISEDFLELYSAPKHTSPGRKDAFWQ